MNARTPSLLARTCLAVGAMLVASAQDAAAQCPRFGPEFAIPGGLPGSDVMLVHDDGSGPALYLGGSFTNHGGTGLSYLARWDGVALTGLGAGLNGQVTSLCAFDDGTGPVLVASGSFTLAGGQPAEHVARWDGTSWAPLGAGLGNGAVSLAQYDDGSGPALFASGDFINSGPQTIYRLAKWQAGQWSQVSNGTLVPPATMVVWDDGTGPALYMAGSFAAIGPLASCNGFAKLQGTTWTSLISGTKNGGVLSCLPFDDGSGPSFFLGGTFTLYDGVSAPGIVRWRNGVLSAVGFGFQYGPSPSLLSVSSLVVHDDGSGPRLHAGGRFSASGPISCPSVARWTGTYWQAVGAGLSSAVKPLASFHDGTGPALWASGSISASGTSPLTGTVRWKSNAWSGLTPGAALNNNVFALRSVDGPGGRLLLAGGDFTGAAPSAGVVNRIAAWNGTQWSSFALGMDGTVRAVESFDAGSGPRIAAAGSFSTADLMPTLRVAQWDGQFWSAMGSGFDGTVNALTRFDPDGAGPQPERLIAAGGFGASGAAPLRQIAAWDGTTWLSLAQGLTDGSTTALATAFLPNGTQRLYAGGSFNVAGAVPAHGIAAWNGTGWSKLGGDVTGTVYSIAVVDGGAPGGPSIVIGGSFTAVHGVPASNVALWTGSQWLALGPGLPARVEALSVFDDGTGAGPRIYAGGQFLLAQGAPASYLARWSGSAWESAGGAVDARVRAFAQFDDGPLGRPGLYLGGDFNTAGGGSSGRIAHIVPCSYHTYCTAKVNSLGCVPALVPAGIPSASASAGFSLVASNVINNKPGLLLYGLTGGGAVPFQGGFLCVTPPVYRSVGLQSGGNPPPNDCSGILTIDMNAFARGLLGGNPRPELSTPGTVVHGQSWSRDPGIPPPQASSLSDAAAYTIGT